MLAPETTKTSLRDLLYVVFKRKSVILLFFTATFCTVTIGTLLIKPTYEASSKILVKIGREDLYVPTVPTSGTSAPTMNINRESQMNSEIEIIRSRSLSEKVVEFLGPTALYKNENDKDQSILRGFLPDDHAIQSPVEKVIFKLHMALKKGKRIMIGLLLRAQAQQSPMEKSVLKFQKNLAVEGVRKSNVIEIRFKHKDPQMAATVVNKLINLYLDRHLHVHKNPQSYTFFQQQFQIFKNKLRQTEERLKSFKKQQGITSINEEQSLLLRQEAELRAALNQTLSQKAETENRLLRIRQQLATTPKTIPQGEEIEHNRLLINTLEARLVELELKEKELLTKYTEQSRLVQSVRDEIHMVRERLAEQESKRYGKSRSGLNVTYQRLKEEFFRNEAELDALKGKKESQSAQLADYQRTIERLNRSELKLNQFQHTIDSARQNYQLYLTKLEESRISNAMDTEKISNVSVIEPARPPLKPVSPKVLLNIVLGVLFGTFGAIGLAFFMEYLDDNLERTEDVEDYLKIPVLASIPELKK